MGSSLRSWTRARRAARFQAAGALLLSLIVLPARAQIGAIRISEVQAEIAGATPAQAIELFNAGSAPVALEGAVIAAGEQTRALTGLAAMPPGGTVLIRWNQTGNSGGSQFFTGAAPVLNPARGSIALFKSAQVTRAEEMVAFVQWGAANQPRADLAAQAGLWDRTAFVARPGTGQTVALLPGATGRNAAEWLALSPTLGAMNAAPMAGYSGWAFVGGQSIRPPALAAAAGGSLLDMASVTPEGALAHRRFQNGAWSLVPGPAGALLQPPALVARDGEGLELVAVGTDRNTYHSRFQGGQWTPYALIGEATTHLPVSLAFNPTTGTAELVIVGPDGDLLHSRFESDQWSEFSPLGDQSGAGPVLAYNAQATAIELLFSAPSTTICQMTLTGSDWVGPVNTGSESPRSPAIAARPDGTLDAAITGADGAVLQSRFRNGTWRAWQPIAGLQSDLPPTLVYSPEKGTTELIAVGRDGVVRQARRTSEVWSAAAPIGALARFAPAAAAGAAGRIEVVIAGQDGNLWHNRVVAEPAQLPAAVSFATTIQPIFKARCSCHVTSFSGGLSLAEGEALASLVDVPSGQAELDLVEPGDPSKSYLLQKLQGTQRSVGGSGSRMPNGSGALSAAQIALIRQWIEQGAQDN